MLKAVYIDADKNYTRIITSDGHRLSLFGDSFDNELDESTYLVVPTDIVKSLTLKTKSVKFEHVNTDNWLMIADDVRYPFKCLQFKMIDYKRMIPLESLQSFEVKQYNVTYLNDFYKIVKILGVINPQNSIHVKYDSEFVTRVRILNYDKYVGIVAPIKSNDDIGLLDERLL